MKQLLRHRTTILSRKRILQNQKLLPLIFPQIIMIIYVYNSPRIPSLSFKFPKTDSSFPPILFENHEKLSKFSYSQVDGCVVRPTYLSEFIRLLGIDPESDNLSIARVLVIGKTTSIGASIVRMLSKAGIPFVATGCRDNIDFSGSNVTLLLDFLNITRTIVTCNSEYPRFSTSDGSAFINERHSEYLNSIFSYSHQRHKPFIYAIERYAPPEHVNLSLKFHGKTLIFPNLLGDNGFLANTVRECAASGRSTVEYYPNESVSLLSSDEAAAFALNSFDHSKTPVIIEAKTIVLSQFLQTVTQKVKECKIEMKKSPFSQTSITQFKSQKIESADSSFQKVQKFIENVSISKGSPYLTILFTGRHDNYGRGFEQRAQNCLISIAQGIERNPLASIEIVIVDFGTQHGVSTLNNILSIPNQLKGKVRYIIVPEEISVGLQKKFNTSLPFFEYISKNIGIRRSLGEFILATNPDNVFPSALFEMVAKRDLSKFTVYRAERWKSTTTTTLNHSIQELIDAAGEPWRIGKDDLEEACKVEFGRYMFLTNSGINRYASYNCAAGDFLLLSKGMWEMIGGFNEMPSNTHVDNMFLGKCMKFLPGYPRYIFDWSTVHQYHDQIAEKRTSISDIAGFFREYGCQGYSISMGSYSENPEWGFLYNKFEEIIQ